nr:MAG TPA: hypothetical protein [Caudoviricetes sp.]
MLFYTHKYCRGTGFPFHKKRRLFFVRIIRKKLAFARKTCYNICKIITKVFSWNISIINGMVSISPRGKSSP